MESSQYFLPALDGSLITCDAPPSIYPCLNFTDIACWNSSSNCWGGYSNITDGFSSIIQSTYCTVDICPLGTFNQAHFDYIPTLSGNALFAGVFGIILVAQVALVVRWRTWGFLVGLFCGLVLEAIGYIGRILIHNQPFAKNPFLLYLICLTIAPAFLSASIYLCLSRIVVAYGTHLSRFAPKTYSITFVTCDIVSLILQAVGGALASTANNKTTLDKGTNIMIAGLSWQVASLILFMGLCGDFVIRVKRSLNDRNPAFESIVSKPRFKLFLWSLAIATLTIFIRSVFRVAELSKGFHGPLDNQEVTYMILEGVMIIVACTVLTVAHPGYAFDGKWAAAKLGHGVKGGIGSGSEVELGYGKVGSTINTVEV